MIAIKEISKADRETFDSFLNKDTDKYVEWELGLSELVRPHEEIAVMNTENEADIENFCRQYGYGFDRNNGFSLISKSKAIKRWNNSMTLFAGYMFYDESIHFGMDGYSEIGNIDTNMDEYYGEFCVFTLKNDTISLKSDYFGMMPWFYYYDGNIFAASNSYHLLLTLLCDTGVELKMNIERSSVNVITSGYLFGAPFSSNLDIQNTYILSPYDTLTFSAETGVCLEKSSFGKAIFSKQNWDSNKYEELIKKAAAEINKNCKAVLECDRFNNVVVDISGGFDSRIVFAAMNNQSSNLRRKIYTYTRTSGTRGDVEIASGITNMYQYPKWNYGKNDETKILKEGNIIKIPNLSRTLGIFSPNSYLNIANYNDIETIEVTGGMGDMCFGYKRIRGELDYGLGEQKLLARLGGCYLHNSVKELFPVFGYQKDIINNTLDRYTNCGCLFQKMHMVYNEYRNRLNFGSTHVSEHNNFRIPLAFSKYALLAKMMYFSKYTNNEIPNEKVSFDILNELNPLMTALPFASNNDDVIPKCEELINGTRIKVIPDNSIADNPKIKETSNYYCDEYIKLIENIDVAEQMLKQIYEYNNNYYEVCLGLYTVLQIMRENEAELHTSHGRETIKKIYDLFFLVQICRKSKRYGME